MGTTRKTGKTRIPKLCRHKASGQAYARVAGKCRYLGLWGSDAAEEAYRALVAGLLAGHAPPAPGAPAACARTLGECLGEYEAAARLRYVAPDGQPTRHIDRVLRCCALLRSLWSRLPATRLAPEHLEATRAEMVRIGWSRQHANGQLGVIRRLFKWMHLRGMIGAEQFSRLKAVEGLRAGQRGARERPPVLPVPEEHFRAVLERFRRTNPVLASAVLVQWLAGCRTGELLSMTAGEIDRSGPVWAYRPRKHKTAHLGRARVVPLVAQAQAEIEARLARGCGPGEPVFSPREAVALARAVRTLNEPGWRSRPEKGDPRPAKEKYTTITYGQAVMRACKALGVPKWRPYQLRHAAATRWRHALGWDAARVLLGHSSLQMTAHYAQDDVGAVLRKLGEAA